MNTSFKKLMSPPIVSLGKRIERKHFSDKPIIIGACPRSGTTLLLSILDSFSNIHAIQRQTYAFTSWIYEDNHWTPDRIDRLFREFIKHKLPHNKKRWCEKTPKNVQYFDKILDYFGENVRLIHMIRDGRDVITSKHPKHNPDEYWISTERWIYDVKLGLKYSNYPNVYTIKYEELINNFTFEMRNLCNFLEEGFLIDENSWREKTTLKKSKHWDNPVENLHSRSIDKWKSETHNEVIEKFMKNDEAVSLLKLLNYIE